LDPRGYKPHKQIYNKQWNWSCNIESSKKQNKTKKA
jgi:hypothetical protein